MLMVPFIRRMLRARLRREATAGAGVGADLGAVFVVGYVAYPVQAVIYGPVAADPGREVGCGGLFGGQAGDGVHRFGAPFRAVQPPAFAGDLNGLAGVREHDPGGHRDDLDAALLDPAMSAGGGGACGWDVFFTAGS
jgi:hypothetical protein